MASRDSPSVPHCAASQRSATWQSSLRLKPAVLTAVKWTHWNDLANIYGTDARATRRTPWTTWACSTDWLRSRTARPRTPSRVIREGDAAVRGIH